MKRDKRKVGLWSGHMSRWTRKYEDAISYPVYRYNKPLVSLPDTMMRADALVPFIRDERAA